MRRAVDEQVLQRHLSCGHACCAFDQPALIIKRPVTGTKSYGTQELPELLRYGPPKLFSLRLLLTTPGLMAISLVEGTETGQ